jgi:polysaccharide pyruvyl transferase WcaK-like protein
LELELGTGSDGGTRVALVGYNGANNTGSEARLLKVIDDVRSVRGGDVQVTVPSLNVANLRRYVSEDEGLRIEAVPSIYHFTVDRVVRESDVMMLVEGSCYMDTWTSSLLGAYLWATRAAHRHGKKSIAYAVDAGDLKPGNIEKVRKYASKTDLIIARTFKAAERLRSWGVDAPIEVTADTAFDFGIGDKEAACSGIPGSRSGKVGLALVDFYLWPVVARPFGRRCDCYRWPYYFSRSKERCIASRMLAEGYARMADEIVERWDRDVVLISMESLDEPMAREVARSMKHPERSSLMSSGKLNAFQMTSGLRELDALVTSRYHAAVLSMAAGVPMMAIGHDRRLEDLFGETGLREELFLRHEGGVDWKRAVRMFEKLMVDEGRVSATVRKGYRDQMARMSRNRALLKEFLDGGS